MVRITIQCEGHEDKVLEGKGVIAAVDMGTRTASTLMGRFSILDLMSIQETITEQIQECIEENYEKGEK